VQALSLLGAAGATKLVFERRFPIFRGGTPPNVDVWIERTTSNIAIESKFTEYFTKERPKFSEAYERLTPPNGSEKCWWEVYKQAKSVESGYLDIAQLVKHYFGLWKHRQNLKHTVPITLLYLFWEPTNADAVGVCGDHREELDRLVEQVHGSQIPLKTMTYSELWNTWSQSGNQELRQHVDNLKARYEIQLEP